ncbi:PD-(D/E)XK nuclease superfamily protein [Syntrophus gentianae]|uniref:PD-(D/E)XK nuclease superfamily protein n=1 Tax=Syntrophus gentianae TaxID=43775 RepID=A0A1H8AMF0_9BACT|nr:PD-(D/E)XK nuclease family protein [Syntrophus gentianae]SEM70929.1 PD-(D/E)XK nuclease superfamily protein [Syntrophus gentianae]
MPDPNSLSDDLHPAVDALIDWLRAFYPDMSGFTVVSMTARGRDFLHHLIHTRIGGLLPTILSFNDYRTRRIAEVSGRTAVPEDEAFIHFHTLRCWEAGHSLPPADTQRLLSFLTTIADFSVTMDELRALDRIGPEQLDRIERFFATMEDFRARLASSGLFYPPFEAGRFADLQPGKDELFVGLPLMTPVNEYFFNRIPKDRLFVDAPLFGPQMPMETPDYETALSLVRRIGVAETRRDGEPPLFTELAERAALPALLSREIDDFLLERQGDGEQLFIVPLDEMLSFYLWEFLFRPIGGQVNFAPWIPFAHFPAAHRLRSAINDGQGLATARRDLVTELTTRWSELDEADRSAFEGAITLCDELERFRPLMGGEWSALAEHFIATKKLRLHGRRTAPIQVVGLGDATGVPYGRAVILPMNSGIFPRKPFSGPYLNLIHLPRIYRTQYEADDLALRQFLSFGRSAHIAALYDQASGQAPSPHFSFLATEFDQRAVKRRMVPAPFHVPTGNLDIENTDELRERLRQHSWSFSSLKKFFNCSCRFILEDMQGLTPPPCFEDEDSANLLIGDFLHRFFAELKEHHPAVERWRERFGECWDRDRELQTKLPDQAVRKAIVQSHLADIAAWEKETEQPLLFSDDVTAAELELGAPFGSGRYQLRGRLDRLQHQGDRELIADLKYKEKSSRNRLLAELVEEPDSFDDRFQLLIYAYLAFYNGRATPGRLDVSHLFLRPRDRGDYEGRLAPEDLSRCDETMERIAQRLDSLLAQELFTPNFRSADCAYCPYKALCLRPDLYRTGGRPW